MEAAVKEESDGIQFNLKHPSFQKLVKLVKSHDAAASKRKGKFKLKRKNSGKSKQKQKQKQKHAAQVKVKSRKSSKKVKSSQEWLDILTAQLSSHSPNACASNDNQSVAVTLNDALIDKLVRCNDADSAAAIIAADTAEAAQTGASF